MVLNNPIRSLCTVRQRWLHETENKCRHVRQNKSKIPRDILLGTFRSRLAPSLTFYHHRTCQYPVENTNTPANKITRSDLQFTKSVCSCYRVHVHTHVNKHYQDRDNRLIFDVICKRYLFVLYTGNNLLTVIAVFLQTTLCAAVRGFLPTMTATVFNTASALVTTSVPGTHASFGPLRPEVYLVWKVIQLILIS